MALLELADQQEEGPERNVVLAVESLLPAMKDIDLRQISEMHLSATYVHPLVQCLLANDAETVAHCSNTMMEKNSENDKRPDYIADVYHRYNFSHSSSFGEIKIDNAPDTRKVLDFYRLAIFGKGAIEKHSLSGIVTFQVIGKELVKKETITRQEPLIAISFFYRYQRYILLHDASRRVLHQDGGCLD